MSQHDFYCPVTATLNLLNQRWNLHLIRSLLDGNCRFNELSRTHGINPRTLCARLRELESHGIIVRVVLCEEPLRIEYQLTEKGQDLTRVVDQLIAWGMRWMDGQTTEPGPCEVSAPVC